MKTITIGRSTSNNCVFSNDTVSSRHASLTLDDSGLSGELRDLGSTNGTFVNGHRISSPLKVTTADSIRFGNETTSLKEIVSKAGATRIQQPSQGIKRFTIGKSQDCNIRMSFDDVSRHHAVIYQTASGSIVIEDSGSTNGTYVNGVRVTSQVLQAGDSVTITRSHPLQWNSLFGDPLPKKKNTSWLKYAAAAMIAAVVTVSAYLFVGNRDWNSEKIYKEYHDAVCWIMTSYGYKVYIDNEDNTATVCNILRIPSSQLIYVQDGKAVSGVKTLQGTGFFISPDGKIATNLHVACPWKADSEIDDLKDYLNKLLAYLGTQNPLLLRSEVRLEPVVTACKIIPDGLPISESNAIDVSIFNASDNIERDVAILQTDTRSLPSNVKHFVDINKADLSDECITEGRKVFTIGFPYGYAVATASNSDIHNQVHDGVITQNRGDYEFGHDAETASGASGSPIFNQKGRLIGIHHAGLTGVTGAQGFNWAIKAKYIKELLNK